MSYRNRGTGSAIRWGFGLGIGLALYRIVFGTLTLARRIVRGFLIAVLVAGLSLILADL